MADKTSIEWTAGDDGTPGATWNPLRGCTRVSPGCQNCYAERIAARFSGPGQPYEGLARRVNGHARWTNTVRLVPDQLVKPLTWRRPRRVFVDSMSDLFHPDVPDEYIAKVFALMSVAHWHTFQVLTKRAQRMADWSRRMAITADDYDPRQDLGIGLLTDDFIGGGHDWQWPLRNVWLGVSVEDQQRADERIPHLLQTPAAVRFLSCEPLLGRVWLLNCGQMGGNVLWRSPEQPNTISWVIAGGESGPGARPMHPDWARSLRDQCVAAKVPFFFKQWGGHTPKAGGKLLDGVTWQQFPEVLP